MGDWIKDNMFPANVISTLILIVIFSFTIGKPYVDKKDNENEVKIQNIGDTITLQLNIIIEGNDSINSNLKRIADGR